MGAWGPAPEAADEADAAGDLCQQVFDVTDYNTAMYQSQYWYVSHARGSNHTVAPAALYVSDGVVMQGLSVPQLPLGFKPSTGFLEEYCAEQHDHDNADHPLVPRVRGWRHPGFLARLKSGGLTLVLPLGTYSRRYMELAGDPPGETPVLQIRYQISIPKNGYDLWL